MMQRSTKRSEGDPRRDRSLDRDRDPDHRPWIQVEKVQHANTREREVLVLRVVDKRKKEGITETEAVVLNTDDGEGAYRISTMGIDTRGGTRTLTDRIGPKDTEGRMEGQDGDITTDMMVARSSTRDTKAGMRETDG